MNEEYIDKLNDKHSELAHKIQEIEIPLIYSNLQMRLLLQAKCK